ncbi:unnamed protein product [Linum tenue]|uniref:Uncharacterized protein n=1 Tax=Linum tenue TaxID=586396 RepID=A0AAV0KAL5_9ROSI|nr:unnamed protein product [Linum tenue]
MRPRLFRRRRFLPVDFLLRRGPGGGVVDDCLELGRRGGVLGGGGGVEAYSAAAGFSGKKEENRERVGREIG